MLRETVSPDTSSSATARPAPSTLAGAGYQVPAARAERAGFLSWYRRHYLLINLPVLMLLTDLALAHFDVAARLPFKGSNDLAGAFARLEARPPRGEPTLLILGNSSIREGADQVAIEQGLSRPGHPLRALNFGLSAGLIDAQYWVVETLAARGISPKAALLGVNGFLLDDHINQDTVYPWVGRRSPYLFFHRSRIRTSIDRSAQYLRAPSQKRKELLVQWDPRSQFKYNRPPSPAEFKSSVTKFVAEFRDRRPSDYPLLEELPGLVAWLEKRGIEPYVVLLPTNPVAAGRTPTHEPLMAAIRAKVAPDHTLDLADAYPADLFYDTGHVNAAGRLRLSEDITSWLRTKNPFLAP